MAEPAEVKSSPTEEGTPPLPSRIISLSATLGLKRVKGGDEWTVNSTSKCICIQKGAGAQDPSTTVTIYPLKPVTPGIVGCDILHEFLGMFFVRTPESSDANAVRLSGRLLVVSSQSRCQDDTIPTEQAVRTALLGVASAIIEKLSPVDIGRKEKRPRDEVVEVTDTEPTRFPPRGQYAEMLAGVKTKGLELLVGYGMNFPDGHQDFPVVWRRPPHRTWRLVGLVDRQRGDLLRFILNTLESVTDAGIMMHDRSLFYDRAIREDYEEDARLRSKEVCMPLIKQIIAEAIRLLKKELDKPLPEPKASRVEDADVVVID